MSSKSPVAAAVWSQDGLSMAERVIICLRFRSSGMNVAPYPITRLKAPIE